MELPPVAPHRERWWLPLLIPAALGAIGIIAGLHGSTRVVHQGPADAIGGVVTAALFIGWPFFAAGARRQRSRLTEHVPAGSPEAAAALAGDSPAGPSALVQTPGADRWYQENGRWYCQMHNARYCKICSS